MIYITGKSGSGKDTVADYLAEHYGFNRVLRDSTRRKRSEDDNACNFIPDALFDDNLAYGKYLEHEEYKKADGEVVKYGTRKEEWKDNDLIVASVNTINSIAQKDDIIIYLYADYKTILNRLINRGDDNKEIKRRMKADDLDNVLRDDIPFVIINNSDGVDIDETCREILDLCGKEV